MAFKDVLYRCQFLIAVQISKAYDCLLKQKLQALEVTTMALQQRWTIVLFEVLVLGF